ncbi:MAG: SlyX family protein [Lentisphaerae bacterium]|nr:SlyX family protein [Lentisphaerota bacterium]
MDDVRLTALEVSVAFQEKTLHDMSEVLYRQQEELDRLKTQVETIRERMTEDEQPLSANDMPPVELPPHY